MAENIKLLRHYIFIDPNDILNDINNNNTLNEIKKIHRSKYTNGEIIKYHGYNDIVHLLNNHDKELCDLFVQINHNYPALLADIGRLIILYNYGGIYHDLKFTSNKKMINYLNSVSPKIELIGEEHPVEKHRVRNTNIIALQKNSKFLKKTLEKIKIKLIKSKDAFGSKKMFEIGSGIYIKKFLNHKNPHVYKFPFANRNMISFDKYVYSKNIKTWQSTNEYIFQKG